MGPLSSLSDTDDGGLELDLDDATSDGGPSESPLSDILAREADQDGRGTTLSAGFCPWGLKTIADLKYVVCMVCKALSCLFGHVASWGTYVRTYVLVVCEGACTH